MWYCRFKRFLTPLQSCTEEGSMNPQLRLSLNPFISSTPPLSPFSLLCCLSFNHLVNKLLLTIKPDTYLTTFSVEKMRNGRNGLILPLLQLQHPFLCFFVFSRLRIKKVNFKRQTHFHFRHTVPARCFIKKRGVNRNDYLSQERVNRPHTHTPPR